MCTFQLQTRNHVKKIIFFNKNGIEKLQKWLILKALHFIYCLYVVY